MSATGAKRKGLGGDHIEGRHAVRELLLSGRRVRELVMADDLDSSAILDDIADLADESRVSVRHVSRSKFQSMARTEGPQGVIAFAVALEPVDLDRLVATGTTGAPFLLIVDGVTDPGNLGALLRTAECAGVTGVVLPRHRAAHVTPTVAKAAQGAIEHLPIATVAGLPAAISELKAAGVWTIGLDTVSDTTLWKFNFGTDPVAVVLGAEGKGLSRLVRERCDAIVTVPIAGQLNSLNVSAAGALAMFEVARARAN